MYFLINTELIDVRDLHYNANCYCLPIDVTTQLRSCPEYYRIAKHRSNTSSPEQGNGRHLNSNKRGTHYRSISQSHSKISSEQPLALHSQVHHIHPRTSKTKKYHGVKTTKATRAQPLYTALGLHNAGVCGNQTPFKDKS